MQRGISTVNQKRRNDVKKETKAAKGKKTGEASVLTDEDQRVSIEQCVLEYRKEGEVSEDDAMEIAWEMHPDLNRMRLAGTLSEELVDDEGNEWSPRMHIQMHAIIKYRLANNDPDGIVDLALEFEQAGKLDSHELRHTIAAAVSEQIWSMTHEGREFDRQRYFEDLDQSFETFVEAKK